MDIVQKIILLIGAIIGVLCGLGIMTGLNEVRSGMHTEDPRKTEKGFTSIIVGGAFIITTGAVGAYVISLLAGIKF